MILWHNKEPIYSVEFDPSSNRLCTTGSDNDVKIWSYTQNNVTNKIEFTYLSSLSKHSKHVNVARFSPGGNLLASGGDDGTIAIWRLNPLLQQQTPIVDNEDGIQMKEVWSIVAVLRAQTDCYDLAWSPNGLHLVSCSTDNSIQIWSPITRASNQLIVEHTHYVQGVSWDPLGRYLVSESSDGTCRIYSESKASKRKTAASKKLNVALASLLSRRSYVNSYCDQDHHDEDQKHIDSAQSTPTKETEDSLSKDHRMFYDENVTTFFRRASWSPEGSLLILPTGKFKANPSMSKYECTSYVFSRDILNKPILHLPSNKPTLVVKFNPLIYQLNTSASHPTILPELIYRMIFAVSTADTVIIYDTQCFKPLLIVSDMHYSTITDLSWSPDGSILMIASEDGFCSYMSFVEGELGTPIKDINDMPACMQQANALRMEAIQNTTAETIQKEQLQQDTSTSVKRKKDEESSVSTSIGNNDENDVDNDSKQTEKKQKLDTPTQDTQSVNNASAAYPTTTTTTTTTATTTSNSNSDSTTTQMSASASKPKRRIQPNLLPPK
ncbi:hypothetical protein SAMD00019534_051260 [Acytostelium subglobosum LB1]|uniref:hypothetical protein n=1 Tax=Acytostelium subglobosum LB1 TaxID=1410327 RepID=UPI000644B4DC|nr:hypothetical protein SAMD00019534_051260 [Acytostelium subglobosum LB1]GAM21951.1 hypothetical protein SAMD00019534_051260 [Acytostelium subglobosum LB1]|eukprot:XP_012755051.1 hypothetical protein SAMD00019534_051260 [Acytostelium subglobosum LB1]